MWSVDLKKENILNRMSLAGSAHQLALLRILLGLQVLYSSSSRVFDLLLVLPGDGKETIFPKVMDKWIAGNVSLLVPITQVLAILLMVGLATRYVALALSVTSLLLFGFLYAKFDAPIPWLYFWFPLILLSFSRCADVWSIDKILRLANRTQSKASDYRWSVELTAGWYAYIYFAAGIAKVLPITKGIMWLDGATSQNIIYERFLDSYLYHVFGQPLFDYTENVWVFAVLSIGALIIELICVLIYFTNRFNAVVIVSVLLMHLFLFLAGVPGFMQIALLLSVSLIDPSVFMRFAKNKNELS